MAQRFLKIIVTTGLLHLFAVSVLATSCVVLTPEQELQLSQEGATNFLYKGFYLGVITVAYLGNMALFFVRTRRWLFQIGLIAVGVPAAIVYLSWEAVNSGCGYGGLPAINYLFLLVPLTIALLVQTILVGRSIQFVRHNLR